VENQNKRVGRSLEVTMDQWERRKAFVGFTEQDVDNLRQLQPIADAYVDEVLEHLYEHFMRFEETRRFFAEPEVLERVKALQREYFRALTKGDYGAAYLENRLHIGRVHQRIGLEPRWYMGAYAVYIQLVYARVLDAMQKDPKKAHQLFISLMKIFTLDQELALTTYAAAREEVINRQSEELLEVSTPVIEVWQGILALPLMGTLDTHRAQMFMERLLDGVVERQAEVALVDITAVPTVDTRTGQHLIEAISAVRLLGAQVVLTGVSPPIAQTLVHLGLNLEGIVTRSSLSAGLRYALDKLGLAVAASISKTQTA
jgi:rsbT co-antagonist protein RsbR